jgi:hypothetical protein
MGNPRRFLDWCWECWLRMIPNWIAPRLALALLIMTIFLLVMAVTPTVTPLRDPSEIAITPAAGCPAQGRPAYRCEINAIRKANGLVTLRPNLILVAAAQAYANKMARNNFFAHDDPTARGRGPATRVRNAGYTRGAQNWQIGENLAWAQGASTPAQIVAQWMRSPPHRKVILTRAFREGGAGIAAGLPLPGADNGTTVVLLLGVRGR